MIITNGQITFEQSDIAQLHPLTQAALSAIIGTVAEGETAQTPAEYLSNQVNACLESYADQYKQDRVQSMRTLAEAIVTATPEKAARIYPLIQEAQEILGI